MQLRIDVAALRTRHLIAAATRAVDVIALDAVKDHAAPLAFEESVVPAIIIEPQKQEKEP